MTIKCIVEGYTAVELYRVVVVVVIREHAHETSTDTKASVLPVGEVVVTAGATLHGATHTTSSDSDMVGASSHVHTYIRHTNIP
jgi:hypothetical protein